METFKRKGFFGGKEIPLKFVALYMQYTRDFNLELTSKYKKTYNGEYGRVYSDILNGNIVNGKYNNLQLYYIGKEGGKFKNNGLVKEFLKYQHTDNDTLVNMYLNERSQLDLY